MNKPKITFGAIKLSVAKPPVADSKDGEPEVSGKLRKCHNARQKAENYYFRFRNFQQKN